MGDACVAGWVPKIALCDATEQCCESQNFDLRLASVQSAHAGYGNQSDSHCI